MRVTELSAIPPFLIEPIRGVLTQQGFPASIITQGGELSVEELVPSLVDSVELRTEWTPSVVLPIRGLVTGPTNPLWAKLKPTLVIRGSRIGTRTIAPYGTSLGGTNDALALVGLGVIGLFGAGVVIGMFINRRR